MDSITNVCRLCMTTDNLSWVFNRKYFSDEQFLDLKDVIFTTIGVEMHSDDIISQKICTKCYQTTIKMYEIGKKARRRNTILKEQYKKLLKTSANEHEVPNAGLTIKKEEPIENEVPNYEINQSVGDLLLKSLSTCFEYEIEKSNVMEVDTDKNIAKKSISFTKPESRVSKKSISSKSVVTDSLHMPSLPLRSTKKTNGNDCYNMEIIQKNSVVSEISNENSSNFDSNYESDGIDDYTINNMQWRLSGDDIKTNMDSVKNFIIKEDDSDQKYVGLLKPEHRPSTEIPSTAFIVTDSLSAAHLSAMDVGENGENDCFRKEIIRNKSMVSDIVNGNLSIGDSDYESDGTYEFTIKSMQWRLSRGDIMRKTDTIQNFVKKEDESDQNYVGSKSENRTTKCKSTASIMADSLRSYTLSDMDVEENSEDDCFEEEAIQKMFVDSDIVNGKISIGDSDYESDGVEFTIKPMQWRLTDGDILRKMDKVENFVKKGNDSGEKCVRLSNLHNRISTEATLTSVVTDNLHMSTLSFINVEGNSENDLIKKQIIRKKSIDSDIVNENISNDYPEYQSDVVDELMQLRFSDSNIMGKIDTMENFVKNENECGEKCVGLLKPVNRISAEGTSTASVMTDSFFFPSLSFMNVEEKSGNDFVKKEIIQTISIDSDIVNESIKIGDIDYESDGIGPHCIDLQWGLSDRDFRTKIDILENFVKEENESEQKCITLSNPGNRISVESTSAFSSSIVKPDITIKNYTILNTIDPKSREIEIVKLLLTKPTELKLEKEKSSQTELPINQQLHVNGTSDAIRFKSLKNVLFLYKIPVLIVEGNLQIQYVSYSNNFKPRQPKELCLWNDLIPIDVKEYQSGNNEGSGPDRISEGSTGNYPAIGITSNFTETYPFNPSFSTVPNQRTYNRKSNFPIQMNTGSINVPVHPFNPSLSAVTNQPTFSRNNRFSTPVNSFLGSSNIYTYPQVVPQNFCIFCKAPCSKNVMKVHTMANIDEHPSKGDRENYFNASNVQTNCSVANKVLVAKDPIPIRLGANIVERQTTAISHPNDISHSNIKRFDLPNIAVPKTNPMISQNPMNDTPHVNEFQSTIYNPQNYSLLVQNKVPKAVRNLAPNTNASDYNKSGPVFGRIRVKSLWELK